MLLASLALFSSPAEAATISKTFCYRFDTSFNDESGVGDDFLTSDGWYNARRIYANVKDLTTGSYVWLGYTNNSGCATVTLDNTHSFAVSAYSRSNLPSGGRLKVVEARDSLVYFGQTATVAPNPKTGVISSFTQLVLLDASASGGEWVNVMAAATHTIHRKSSAWPGGADDYYFFLEDSPLGGEAHMVYLHGDHVYGVDTELDVPGVLIEPTSSKVNSKRTVAHELGHLLEFKLNCEGNGGKPCDVGRDIPKIESSGPETGCTIPGVSTSSHHWNSKEYQSYAAHEGWAHYVSAFAFNKVSENDCRLKPDGDVYWNYGTTQSSDEPFSCQGAENGDSGGVEVDTTIFSTAVNARDAFGQFCVTGGDPDSMGTEHDWLRFWWDIHSGGHSLDFEDATHLLAIAGSDTWCACPSGGSGCGTSCSTNLPASRLQAAFYAFVPGVGDYAEDAYNDEKNNGVTR